MTRLHFLGRVLLFYTVLLFYLNPSLMLYLVAGRLGWVSVLHKIWCSSKVARVCCLTKTGCTSRLASHLCCWRWSLIGLFHYMPTDCLVSSISLSAYCQVQLVILPYQLQHNISIYKQCNAGRQAGSVTLSSLIIENFINLLNLLS